MLEDKLTRPLESMIEIERSDDRLECIGEDVWVLMSTSIVLTARYLYRVSKMESMSNLS